MDSDSAAGRISYQEGAVPCCRLAEYLCYDLLNFWRKNGRILLSSEPPTGETENCVGLPRFERASVGRLLQLNGQSIHMSAALQGPISKTTTAVDE